MEKKNKILIIKLGYSETLDQEISRRSSLGDVLRTTVLLHAFKETDYITWLVDEKAFDLLDGNPKIDRILIYDLSVALQLLSERFDTVINFEKVPGICALTERIRAWRHFGFRFDSEKGEALAYDNAENVLSMCLNPDKKRKSTVYWQQALMQMIGKKWKDEEYILGYSPKSEEKENKIGFNYEVGSKWPNKAWPMENWKKLEVMLKKDGRIISWQQGKKSIKEYIEWINSCQVIVSNDSLGLHIALALKKKVAAIFGPTASREVYMYKRGLVILPGRKYDCVPCLLPECKREKICTASISAKKVYKIVNEIF